MGQGGGHHVQAGVHLLEFSTKKYVLFTTYFLSSFQITRYFQRTLWPRFDSTNSRSFGYRFTVRFSDTVIPQLQHSYFTSQSEL